MSNLTSRPIRQPPSNHPPSLLVLFEIEGEVRVQFVCDGMSDELRLRDWLSAVDAPEQVRHAIMILLSEEIRDLAPCDISPQGRAA